MEILIQNATRARLPLQDIERAAALALREELGQHAEECELSILLADARAIRALNQTYRGVAEQTDVLAFPMAQAGETLSMLGDVVICPSVAARQAREHGHSLAEELAILTVHGVLHLLGHTDEEPEARQRMFRRQDEILKKRAKDSG